MSGIVLAGGRSTRFGSDKLAARLGGLTMLERSTSAVADVCEELIVVLAPSGPEPELPDRGVPIRFVRDREAFGGPVAGLVAGLEVARSPVVLVVAGDMPWLTTEGLTGLIDLLRRLDLDLTQLVTSDGPRPLPFAARTSALSRAAERVLGTTDRSVRALGAWVSRSGLIPVGSDDPSLRDVDRPVDLGRVDGVGFDRGS